MQRPKIDISDLPSAVDFDRWDEDAYVCKICSESFKTNGALNFHMMSRHSMPFLTDEMQWDYGQLDLRNGVDALWHDLMKEHDLPRLVFLYGNDYVSIKNKEWRFMPVLYDNKVTDSVTGIKHMAMCFPDKWLDLDPEAKCSTIAHMAVHLECKRHGLYDVSFNKKFYHSKDFRDIATTYDMRVSLLHGRGYVVTIPTDEFKKKHEYAMRLISRYHRMKVNKGCEVIRCRLDKPDSK